MSIILKGQSSDRCIMLCYGPNKDSENNYAALAIKDDAGGFTIEEGHTEDIQKRINELEKEHESLKNATICTIAVLILFLAGDIFSLIHHQPFIFMLGLLVFEIGAFIPSITVIDAFFGNYKTEEMVASFNRCHGAEHKIVNAYTKLKRIPSVEEARAFSRIHKECGCVSSGNRVVFFAALGSAISFHSQLGTMGSFLIVLVTFLLIYFFTTSGLNPWKLIEYANTAEPDDLELEMALSALERLLFGLNQGACIIKDADRKWSDEHFNSKGDESSSSQY